MEARNTVYLIIADRAWKTTFVMTRLLKNAAAQNKDVLYICNRKALYAQVDQIAADMTQSFKNSFPLQKKKADT